MAINKVRLIHLYPDELNLYGDGGNVLCLKNRLAWRGYEVETHHVGIGDRIPDFDILFIGGGQDREMKIISADLKRKSDMLCYCVNSGKTILAICGGFQLLGEYYRQSDGTTLSLTGALPFYTVAGDKRLIGNIVVESSFGSIVGFENHSGKTYLSDSLKPLGNVVSGYGNNGDDREEGLIFRNTFATYIHGPLLPKNPVLADEIIRRALSIDTLPPLDDDIEVACNNQLVKKYS